MGTTPQEIAGWFDRGVLLGHTHMIVACDTFDYENYPSYVEVGKDPWMEYDRIRSQPMTRVMEVYDLKMDRQTQLDQYRVFNLPSTRSSPPATSSRGPLDKPIPGMEAS